MTESSDDELVGRARAPGPAGLRAYAQLVARHQGKILRLATYLLQNDADAEDVTQDTFVRAHANLHRYADHTHFSRWLRTIATRLSFNARRDKRVRAAEPDDDERPGSTPSSTRTAVEWTLAQLAYPYREALVLRFVEELSFEEIAETLDIGLSAAKMRVARAREAFYTIYAREHGSTSPPAPEPLVPP